MKALAKFLLSRPKRAPVTNFDIKALYAVKNELENCFMTLSTFPRKTRTTLTQLSASLVFALALSACGGDSNDNEGDSSNGDIDNSGITNDNAAGDTSGGNSNEDTAANVNEDTTATNNDDAPSAPENNNPPPSTDSSESFFINNSTPEDGSDTRSLETTVMMTFNKPLIAATAEKENFTLANGNTNIDFDFDHNGSSITMDPSTRLAPNTTYTVTVNESVMSEDGETMPSTSWNFTTAGNLGATTQDAIDGCMSDDDMAMLDAVNTVRSEGYRCARGQRPATEALQWSCVIANAADRHSNDMATNNFHAHTGSDGSNHAQRMVAAGFPQNRASGENIAAGYTTVSDVMEGWLTSQTGHCSNLMNANYTDFGSSRVIAPAGTTNFGTYWTQNFGRP